MSNYSYKSFKYQNFVDIKPEEFNGSEIIGASFYQVEPFTDVFPKDVKNCTLTRCNLDNCNIPSGFTVNGGTNKHIKSQNDGEYWVVDTNNKPISPRDVGKFDACGLSKSPLNIPATLVAEPVTFTNDPVVIEQKKIAEIMNNPVKARQLLINKGAIIIDPIEVVVE
jgi:hypothetical protein